MQSWGFPLSRSDNVGIPIILGQYFITKCLGEFVFFETVELSGCCVLGVTLYVIYEVKRVGSSIGSVMLDEASQEKEKKKILDGPDSLS